MYAKEISIAYGIASGWKARPTSSAEGKLVPSFAESVQDYDFLRTANVLAVKPAPRAVSSPCFAQPAGYPVAGRLMGAFGDRTDPFSGEGAFHKGVDISAPTGTPVHATATASWCTPMSTLSGYGRLVILDHGGAYQTYYAHLSRIFVRVGQEVRRGEMVGRRGQHRQGDRAAPALRGAHRRRSAQSAPVPGAKPFRTSRPLKQTFRSESRRLRRLYPPPARPADKAASGPLFCGTLSLNMRILVVLAALASCACGPATQAGAIPEYGYEVVHAYPHDPLAFTQGLFYLDGYPV